MRAREIQSTAGASHSQKGESGSITVVTLDSLLAIFADAPLIASVQASEGSPVDDPETLLKLAQASLANGVRVLRLQGIANIGRIKSVTGAPVIGLIKKSYPVSEVYITPTSVEVDALIEADCEIIALDGTERPRPNGERFEDLVARIHAAGRLAMADCDSINDAIVAVRAGADLVGSTLCGYTASSRGAILPTIGWVRLVSDFVEPPRGGGSGRFVVIAEGGYAEPWQVQAALRAGAKAVVVGGALNDPVKQTRAFAKAAIQPKKPVGAVDIGGTWLRAGVISPDGEVLESERIPVPKTRIERNAWINAWLRANGTTEVGIGAGGIIHPVTGEVLFSKPIILDHVGTVFSKEIDAERVVALNDGHATAWGHAMYQEFAGTRVATLALGTGVGFGVVNRGRIMMGDHGEHARINDTPTRKGKIYDDLLGGAAVTANPSESQQADALEAATEAVHLVNTLYYPEHIVIAGGIGLQPWMDSHKLRLAAPTAMVHLTPYGPDAGLVGAGFLALYPPPFESMPLEPGHNPYKPK